MATRLKNLTLNEVAMVDKGANQHAHITLFKRDAEEPGTLEKDMYDVSLFADMLSSLAYLTRSAAYEAADEGDNSPVPARLKGWLQSGAQIFQQMAAEEISELIAATDVSKNQTEEDNEMPTEIEKKAADEQVKKLAEVEAALAKANKELAFAKMSEAHQAYSVEKKLEGESLDGFVAKSAADRDAQIKAEPVVKVVDPEITKRDSELADLRKRLEATEEKNAVAEFAKKATELGLTESHGETLRKAYGGDKEAMGKIEQLIKGLTEQVKTGKVFEEFGNKGIDSTSGTAKMDAQVAEMQKADNSLTKAQAIAKIAVDPKHRELWNEYKVARAAAQ